MTTAQVKQDRIVILSKAFGGQWEQQFFNDIQTAFDDGYRIAQTGLRDDASMRNYRGRIGKAIMYLEGKEPEAWKPAETMTAAEVVVEREESKLPEKEDHTPMDLPIKEEAAEEDLATGVVVNTAIISLEDQLKELTTNKDLREFAEKNGFEVPDRLKNPKAIKKFIQVLLDA